MHYGEGRRFENAVAMGFETARSVLKAREGIKLESWVTVREFQTNPFYTKRTVSGRVCYVNEHYFTIHTGKYRESFRFVDLVTGKVRLI